MRAVIYVELDTEQASAQSTPFRARRHHVRGHALEVGAEVAAEAARVRTHLAEDVVRRGRRDHARALPEAKRVAHTPQGLPPAEHAEAPDGTPS